MLAPRAKRKAESFGYASLIRHLGGFGLFLIAIVDSSPIPTFGGLDILLAILSARHAQPWYYYALSATLGSILGAVLTYRTARAAGAEYLEKKFGRNRVRKLMQSLERWGTGALAVCAAAPIPLPTGAFFAASGVLNYSLRKFIFVVALCRGIRYSLIAWIASRYGGRFIHALSHPKEYLGWFLLFGISGTIIVVTVVILRRAHQHANQVGSP